MADLQEEELPKYHYDVERPHAWVVRAGKEAKFVDDFKREGVVSIGYHPAGDLSGRTPEEIGAQVAEGFAGKPRATINNVTHQLQAFALGIQEGDLVLSPTSDQTEVLLGRVIGPYEYRDHPVVGNFRHYHRVRWLHHVKRKTLPAETQKSLNAPITVYWAGAADKLRKRFPIENDPSEGQIDPLGPPKWTNAWWVNQGTTFKEESEGGYVWAPNSAKAGGAAKKHWRALEGMQVNDLIFSYARGAIQAVSRVTHSAEVVERPSDLPITEWESQGWQVRTRYFHLDDPIALTEIPQEWRLAEGGPFDINGAVKQQYANHVSENFVNLLINKFGDRIRNSSTGRSEGGNGGPQVEPTQLMDLVKRRMNVVFYGPPGTGKTYSALQLAEDWEEENGNGSVRKVTFHPSYGYEDFVQGFRPDRENPGQFALQPGILLRICDDARKESDRDFLLLIDEINRGDVARVFGELITYIERDKRGVSFDLAQDETDQYEIPPNVYFLGTMNTADKSVSLLDVALRRRFAFVEFRADPDAFSTVDEWVDTVDGLDLGQLLDALNGRLLAEGVEVDRAIGHALLAIPKEADNPVAQLKERIEYDIAPLVAEYSYLDRGRIARILPGLVDDHGRFLSELSESAVVSRLKSLVAGVAEPVQPAGVAEIAPELEAEALQAELEP